MYATGPGRGALPGHRFGRPVTAVCAVLTVAPAAVAGCYVVQAGDPGARAVRS
ncbi:hypothetical protein [Nonomuraea sp. NPDC049309]|uniref:hypothetical protein n=1 Tax=Nonomuraea sp. NPDC049309 TaxID=3364350 RepID=UPI00370FD1EA